MRAVVIGAAGGIGAALVDALAARGADVHALSRAADGPARIDIGDPASIAAAAAAIRAPVDWILIATGTLQPLGHAPERALRDLDPDALAESFRVNTIGPALALRHFAPLLPRDRRGVIAALSARVGSIGDNRLGGWYGYRASKAALNMIVRCAAIELARTRPQALCVGLHPGTVDTGLSRPFQARVDPARLFAPADAASRLLRVLDGLRPEQSGGCYAWDGSAIRP